MSAEMEEWRERCRRDRGMRKLWRLLGEVTFGFVWRYRFVRRHGWSRRDSIRVARSMSGLMCALPPPPSSRILEYARRGGRNHDARGSRIPDGARMNTEKEEHPVIAAARRAPRLSPEETAKCLAMMAECKADPDDPSQWLTEEQFAARTMRHA